MPVEEVSDCFDVALKRFQVTVTTVGYHQYLGIGLGCGQLMEVADGNHGVFRTVHEQDRCPDQTNPSPWGERVELVPDGVLYRSEIVFGLSMDYGVFLMTRIREEYDQNTNNSQAVADGLAATARVITAAALIMVFVFASFVLEDIRTVKILGLGLAAAVAIDATVVRMASHPSNHGTLGRQELVDPPLA